MQRENPTKSSSFKEFDPFESARIQERMYREAMANLEQFEARKAAQAEVLQQENTKVGKSPEEALQNRDMSCIDHVITFKIPAHVANTFMLYCSRRFFTQSDVCRHALSYMIDRTARNDAEHVLAAALKDPPYRKYCRRF